MANAGRGKVFTDAALFDVPGSRKRRHELHADHLVRRLRADGTLGDHHDLAASALRAAARAVDTAEAAAATTPTSYAAVALSQATTALVEILARFGLTIGGAGDDQFAAFLEALKDDAAPDHPAEP